MVALKKKNKHSFQITCKEFYYCDSLLQRLLAVFLRRHELSASPIICGQWDRRICGWRANAFRMCKLWGSGGVGGYIQSSGLVRKICFPGSSERADALPAPLHQPLMCREATKYGSRWMSECKAAAPENRQTCSSCPLRSNDSHLCISVTAKL